MANLSCFVRFCLLWLLFFDKFLRGADKSTRLDSDFAFLFLSRFTVTASQSCGIFPFLVPRNNVNASTKVKVLRIVKMWKKKKSCFNKVYFRETCAIGHRFESLLLFLQLHSQPAGSLCTKAPVFLFYIFFRLAFIRFFGFPAALFMRCF